MFFSYVILPDVAWEGEHRLEADEQGLVEVAREPQMCGLRLGLRLMLIRGSMMMMLAWRQIIISTADGSMGSWIHIMLLLMSLALCGSWS